MSSDLDALYGAYARFDSDVLRRVREQTYGEDFGQNSWTTGDELRDWVRRLELGAGAHVLDVACGSGGPALFLAQLLDGRVTGVDIHAEGIARACEHARASGLASRVAFEHADAAQRLSFAEPVFDAVVCIDAANHFADRSRVLSEWRRVLKPGGRLLFTDPVVVTGFVSSEELALRSSIGYFVFAPPGATERLIADVGLQLERTEDRTDGVAVIAKRWFDARAADRDALIELEGEPAFTRVQQFLAVTQRLASERRLSRIAYIARKPLRQVE